MGICMLSRQNVCRHSSQKKCICRFCIGQLLSLVHISYLVDPLPSSNAWIAWCSRSTDKVREIVDLSSVSIKVSNSRRDTGLSCLDSSLKTMMRAAVGFIPLFFNLSTHWSVDMANNLDNLYVWFCINVTQIYRIFYATWLHIFLLTYYVGQMEIEVCHHSFQPAVFSWIVQSLQYSPFLFIKSLCVPCSTIRPLSNTMILSAFLIVFKLLIF